MGPQRVRHDSASAISVLPTVREKGKTEKGKERLRDTQ